MKKSQGTKARFSHRIRSCIHKSFLLKFTVIKKKKFQKFRLQDFFKAGGNEISFKSTLLGITSFVSIIEKREEERKAVSWGAIVRNFSKRFSTGVRSSFEICTLSGKDRPSVNSSNVRLILAGKSRHRSRNRLRRHVFYQQRLIAHRRGLETGAILSPRG